MHGPSRARLGRWSPTLQWRAALLLGATIIAPVGGFHRLAGFRAKVAGPCGEGMPRGHLCGVPRIARHAAGGRRCVISALTPGDAVEAYAALLIAAPVPTKIATAAALGGAGDLIAQLAESSEGILAIQRAPDSESASGSAVLNAVMQRYDRSRGMAMVAFSGAYTGAFQAWWIGVLQQNIHLPYQFADAALKTVLCQFGSIPLVYMPAFFLITGAVRGMSVEASIANGRANYVRIYSRNVGYWIPVQMLQFFYVPQEWQISFLCAAGLVWSIILSSLSLSANRGEQASLAPTASSQNLRLDAQSPVGDAEDSRDKERA